MNLVLLFKDDFVQGTDRAMLTGRRHKHIRKVHRASVGDTLSVGLAGGMMGTGTITRMESASLLMDVELTTQPPPPLPLRLILALPRPKVLRRLILSITSMGVKEIVLLNAFRVEKSYWQSPALEDKALMTQAVLGLEQAKDTVLPSIRQRPLFKPFVEDILPDLVSGTTCLTAHPGGDRPCPRELSSPVTLAVGPEGGFIPYEVEKLESAGFQTVDMGERILRVETAVPALVSRLF